MNVLSLNDSVSNLPKVGPYYRQTLSALGIKTIGQLLYHLPTRYLDFSKLSPIANIKVGETVTVKGQITFIKNQTTKKGRRVQIGSLADPTGEVALIWFNQPYITRMIYPNQTFSVAGKVVWFGRQKALIAPFFEAADKDISTNRILPIYPETKGLTSKWIRSRMADLKPHINSTLAPDHYPASFLKKYLLPPLSKSLQDIHFPKSEKVAQIARRRLAFDELLFLHLLNIQRKKQWKRLESAYKLQIHPKETADFIQTLPFELTDSQQKVFWEIAKDLGQKTPMNRILEGDVGSGKTIVAALAILEAFFNGYQAVVMAPTQILAQQHFNSFTKLFAALKVRVVLVSSGSKVGDVGRCDVIVGTHSLIHKYTDFDKVALVVIDEQHKFGVEQRTHLINKTTHKNTAPHVLTMTATPIPRTIALTLYGDMELSAITQLPKYRIKPTTWIVPPHKKNQAYRWIADQIKKRGIQAFVVCPIIDQSEAEMMQEVVSVTDTYKDIVSQLPNLRIGLLHGRMKNPDKEKVIAQFNQGSIDILVSTPVVEVGVDVPNANIMVVHSAERFGLAQLHQLRGRVGRGVQKSYCLLLTDSKSDKTTTRLTALQTARSGMELAEADLSMRGPGEIFGLSQHGMAELKIASWQDIDLIKKTKVAAQKLTADKNEGAIVQKILAKIQN